MKPANPTSEGEQLETIPFSEIISQSGPPFPSPGKTYYDINVIKEAVLYRNNKDPVVVKREWGQIWAKYLGELSGQSPIKLPTKKGF